MSRKCIIEKYLHQLNFSDDKFIVMADDFKMIADLALNQLAISKTETTSCEWCKEELSFEVVWYSFGSSFVDDAMFCPNCGRKLTE